MARIGIVIYSLAGGGAERMAVNLSHEFISMGHEVDYLLGCNEGEYLSFLPRNSAIIFPDKPSAKNWRKSICIYIEKYKPDVLLGMMEGASVIALQASMKSIAKTPVVARIPNYFSVHCKKSPRWKERYLMPWAARWFFPRAKRIIAISEGVRRDIILSLNLDASKVVTLYNPAFESQDRTGWKPTAHPWFSPNRTWLSVITAGRLTEQKQQDVLLKAIARSNLSRDTRLVLLGQGEREAELRRQSYELGIADKVDFVGFVDNPSDYFSQADVFALSSAWEGFGNVLVEALAVGVPVVSTNCPSGPSEILAEGRFGQLIPVGDSDAMSNAILIARETEVDPVALRKHLKQFETRSVAREYLRVMGVT